MHMHSESWHRSQAGQAALEDEVKSEFGVTLADAGRLLRKAKHVWVMFRIGPGDEKAIFRISKASVLDEIKLHQGGTKTYRPSELCFDAFGGPILIFGGVDAIERAAASRKEGMAT
jgi:xanthine dehydrogenase molybdopterin-binding subunit B